MRPIRLAGIAFTAAAIAVLVAATAHAQGTSAQTVVQAGDTFPAQLGYAAIGLAGAAGATMSTVVAKLWSKVTDLQARLDLEQKERREEAEKLLREQKDIMREVMTVCAQIATALAENTTAIKKLVAEGNG